MKKRAPRPKSAVPPAAPASRSVQASRGRRPPSDAPAQAVSGALRNSEAYLRALINTISDPAVLLDLKGSIILANEAMAKFLQKDLRDIIGRDTFSFMPPVQAKPRRDQFEEIIRSGKSQVFEAPPLGLAFTVRMHPIFDAAGQVAGAAVVHHDVRQLRSIQETLQEQEAKYRNIVESAHDGIATLKDTTITFVNPSLLRIGGYKSGEIVGKSILDFIHPQEIPKILEYVARRRRDPATSAKYETILKAKNGDDIYVEISASLLEATSGKNETLVIIRDNTDRKRSESALREAEERNRQLVDNSLAGIYIVQDNVLKFCNRKLAEMFGYDNPEEMIGKSNQTLVAPESVSLVNHQLALRESGATESFHYEFKAVRKDGLEFDVEVFGSKFTYQSRPAILGTMIDITERKLAIQAVTETNIRLQALLQAMPDVVFFKDIYGHNLEVNKAFEDIVGLPRDQILGWADDQIFPGDVVRRLKDSDALVLREGRPVHIQEQFTAPGGRLTYFDTLKAPIMDDEGSPIGLIGVSRDITEIKKAENIQSSILRIAQASISSESLDAFYRSVHTTIAELMPAKNFYIAVYDEASGLLTFPYFIDEFDETPAPKPLGRGLTEYVFRTGQPLLATPEIFIELEKKNEVESIGSPSIDWLGTPLKIQDRTFGVLVVQSYTEGVRYDELERDILQFVSGQVAMAIQRRQAADEISEREQFLSGVLDSIQDGISILDTDFTILRTNRAMETWYAHAMPLIGKKCYQAYHLREKKCTVCPTAQTLEKKQSAREVVARVGKNGQVTGWLDLYSFPFIDQKTGQMKGVIEYVRDITQQKGAEDKLQSSLQEKEVLLREIHHRVKNNLQVIQALISLQARQIKDGSAAELYRESQNRIRSMALVHERLYQSSNLSRIDFSEYIRSLVVHLFHSLLPGPSRIGLKMDLQPVELDISLAIPLGLIINELVSNALKHAFPEPLSGEVTVIFRRKGPLALVLGVKDDGQGLPPDFDVRKTETLGMQIIMTLVSQIDGRLEISPGPGAGFFVEFPEKRRKDMR